MGVLVVTEHPVGHLAKASRSPSKTGMVPQARQDRQTNLAPSAFRAFSSRSKITAAGVAPGGSRVTASSRASRCSRSLAGVATACIRPRSTISPVEVVRFDVAGSALQALP